MTKKSKKFKIILAAVLDVLFTSYPIYRYNFVLRCGGSEFTAFKRGEKNINRSQRKRY